jgi:hypothetical protein
VLLRPYQTLDVTVEDLTPDTDTDTEVTEVMAVTVDMGMGMGMGMVVLIMDMVTMVITKRLFLLSSEALKSFKKISATKCVWHITTFTDTFPH